MPRRLPLLVLAGLLALLSAPRLVAQGRNVEVIGGFKLDSESLRAARIGVTQSLHDLDVVGTTAYLALGTGDLMVLDVSDPASPKVIGGVRSRGRVVGSELLAGAPDAPIPAAIAVRGGMAYIASGQRNGIFHVMDVADPTEPRVAATVETVATAMDVHLLDDVAVVSGSETVQAMDIRNPVKPIPLGNTDGGGELVRTTSGLFTLAWLGNAIPGSSSRLVSLDLSDPLLPGERHWSLADLLADRRTSRVGGVVASGRLQASGDVLFLPAKREGLLVLDVSNPLAPRLLATTATMSNVGSVYDVALLGNIAFLATGGDGLRILDVSRPSAPQLVGLYVGTSFHRLVAREGLVFVFGLNGFVVMQYTGPNAVAPALLSRSRAGEASPKPAVVSVNRLMGGGTAAVPPAATDTEQASFTLEEIRFAGNLLRPDVRIEGVVSGSAVSHAEITIRKVKGSVMHVSRDSWRHELQAADSAARRQGVRVTTKLPSGLRFGARRLDVEIALQDAAGERLFVATFPLED